MEKSKVMLDTSAYSAFLAASPFSKRERLSLTDPPSSLELQ